MALPPPINAKKATFSSAVLVSGGVANVGSLRAFRDSVVTNLIDSSEDVEFHLFFYVRLPAEMSQEVLERELKSMSSARVWLHRIVLDDDHHTKSEAQIRVDHPHYSYSAPFEFNQFNTLSMYWKLYVVDQFRRRYEFETGVCFDAVVRIRPDLVLHDPLDLRALDLRRRDVLHLPWFNSSMRLAFDQLGVGPPEAMRAYAKAYYNVPYLTESSALTLGFHPEHTLYMHLQDAGLSMAKMRCRTSIARRKGEEEVESVDSFARLRAEFGSAALSCEEDFVAGSLLGNAPTASAPRPASAPVATRCVLGASPLLPDGPSSPHAVYASAGPAGGGDVDWAAVAASALGPLEQRLESRVASLEEARQREHAAQAERLATLTAELANERMLRQAAESCLAMAERHGAQLGGITLVATIVLAVVATAGLGAVGASLRR